MTKDPREGIREGYAQRERATRGFRERTPITNVNEEWIKHKGESVLIQIYKPIDGISAELLGIADGWPRTVAGALFVCEPTKGALPSKGAVRILAQTDDLFAWIQETTDLYWTESKARCPRTKANRTPPARSDFFKHVRATAPTKYLSYSMLPHHPEMDGIYYVPCNLPESDGKALAEFMAALNPETEEDRGLMLAALLTPGWGGPPGTRPAFVFSSTHGVGSGKSATAEAFANIWGGPLAIAKNEDWKVTLDRLLSDDGLACRILYRDNLKGRGGGEEIESLITSQSISGKRMYHGNFSRTNYLTCYFSANTPRLTKDLANRSVIIKLGAPRHDQGFVGWAANFIEDHRAELIADLLAVLKSQPLAKIPLEARDRWQAWQDGVLARISGGDRLAALAIERRGGADADDEDASDASEAIRKWIVAKNLDPDRHQVKITRSEMRELLVKEKVLPESFGKSGAYTYLSNLLGSNGPLRHLNDSKSRKGGRTWVWEHTGPIDPIESGDSDIPV